MGFAELTTRFNDYKDIFEMKESNQFNKLKKQLNETHNKVINLQQRLNDDDRYLTQNLLLELKGEKRATFDATEKRYLIDNRVVTQTENGDPNKLFRLQGTDYGPNLSIKPTISKDFQSFKNNMSSVQKLANYIQQHHSQENEIFTEYGTACLLDKELGNRNSPLRKSGTLFWGYETGGASGGNCWGGEAEPYSVNVHVKQEFPALKEFLKDVAPDITFLQYDDLKKYIQSDEVTEREYYGNHTEYNVEYITAKDLYKGLTELGFDIEQRIDDKMENTPSQKSKSNRRMKISES